MVGLERRYSVNNEPIEIKELKVIDDYYYNHGTSEVSDEEYDELKEKARELFPDHPYLGTVGAKVSKGKVTLPYVLGSLNKVKPDNIIDWFSKRKGPYAASEKLDGVSFYVEYEDGKVVRAATRGDGYTGVDITEKARKFCPSFTSIGKFVFRCEAMLLGNIHKDLGFKTARNGAAGIINRDDMWGCGFITPFYYEVIEAPFTVSKDETEYHRIRFLENNFKNVPEIFIFAEHHTVDDLLLFLKKCEQKDYEIDGLVITPMDYERENVLYPENKVALKVLGESVKATVDDVEWRVSRSGRVMPVVVIEPIEIEGVTISRATGHNAAFIYENRIGYESQIGIVRSGSVIPYITSVDTHGDFMELTNCPSCNYPLKWKGVDLVCESEDCGEKSYYKVEHFLRSLGAENITVKTLTKLGLNTIESCYEVDEWSIAEIEGFGIKRGQQIVDEINGILHTTPDKLLRSFGIKNVGRTASKAITDVFSLDDMFSMRVYDLYPKLTEINGIGVVIAENLILGLPEYFKLYNFLKEKGLAFEGEGDKEMDGIKFCLTGKGPMKRPELQEIIERKGGEVKSMSKTTNYLVTADTESQSGKSKKARQYGVSIISYEELLEMLE
jgi:DNA ligase (NAD+)